MEETWLYISLSLISLLVFKLLLQTIASRRRLSLPPSPPSLPVIGHLHLIKRPLHRTLQKISEKYGKVFSLWFGSRLFVVVSSPSAVQECFNENDIILANRPDSLIGRHLAYNSTTIIASPYGDHWRNLRRLSATEIFSTSRLNSFSGIRRDEVKRLLKKLAHNSSQEFVKVELKSLFSELTFNVVMRMVAGKRYYGDDVSDEEQAGRFRDIIKQTTSLGGASHPQDFIPVLKWVDPTGYKKMLIRLGKRADEFFQGLIDEHRNKNKEEKGRNSSVIDHLLSLQESQPDYYSDPIIKGLMQVSS